MRKGFSLVELMVVVAVIAVLVLGYQMFFGGATDKARTSKSIEFADKLKKSIGAYYADTSYYPGKAQQLWANPNGAPNWYGPYAEAPNGNTNANSWPHTPWGGTGTLECSNGNWVRLSMNGCSPSVCQLIDKQVDDGNQSSGNVQWDGNNNRCLFYLVRSSSVRCK